MSEVIISDGYSIHHDKKRNRIIIGLPQTFETARTTALPIVSRKTDFSEAELMFLLGIMKYIATATEQEGER